MSYLTRGFLACFLMGVYSSAQAHMKWFGNYDVTARPVPFPEILNYQFIVFLTLAASVVFVARAIDGIWVADSSRVFLKRFFLPDQDYASLIIRLSTGIFFFSLWLQGEVILTPEISRSDEQFVEAIQLAIAAATLSSRLCFLAGIGIITLYGYCIYLHGTFHLLDYMFFLGFANYLIWYSLPKRDLARHLFLLYVTLSLSLMWGAMEKFSYPHWYFPLLNEKPYLTFGLAQDTFVRLSGFVELTLAFLLLFSRNVLLIVALVFNGIFVGATMDFGKVDAIGHLLIMAMLVVMAVEGPSNHALLATALGNRSAPMQSGLLVASFVGGTLLLLALYHFLQYFLCT